MPTAEFRFYEELNDHLPASLRKCSFTQSFAGTPAVKDVIEALGVPHTEVDLILVNGRSVRLSQRLGGGERVAVYPMFERFDIRPLHRLGPRPLRRTRFVADVHLGRLARYLRLLGFDTRYSTDLDGRTLVAISVRDRRILLTRDVALHPLTRAAAAARVPPRVFRRFRRFMCCRGCGRCYWRGTHYSRLKQLTLQGRFAAAARDA